MISSVGGKGVAKREKDSRKKLLDNNNQLSQVKNNEHNLLHNFHRECAKKKPTDMNIRVKMRMWMG